MRRTRASVVITSECLQWKDMSKMVSKSVKMHTIDAHAYKTRKSTNKLVHVNCQLAYEHCN